MSAILVLRK
jgi:hypothetical protein